MKTFSKEPGAEPGKQIICPVCGSAKNRRLWSFQHHTFVRCPECHLVYQNPQPLVQQLAERYDEEYFAYEKANEERYFELMKLGLEDLDFKSLTSRIPDEKKTIIDIGCATGRLISHLKESGFQVQGAEICRPSAEYGIRSYGVPIHIGTLESGRFPSGSFSIVHCSHLIEHLTDPHAFLEEIGRILSPSGLVIISTPNIAGFQARIMGPKWRSAIPDHVVLYSKRTLKILLEANGFEIVRIKTWGGIGMGIVPHWIKKPADILAKKLGVGDVMIVLAKRAGDRHPYA